MNVFILPFGKISILPQNIAEVVINEGVLIDKTMIKVYQNVLKSHLQSPFSVLINKENAYSYTFDAQVSMGESMVVMYRAVVVYNNNADMATRVLIDINKNSNWNVKIFRERDAALDWLLQKQNNKSAI